eukprot:CAMPEP_0114496336 /NCGR_PEP_ID=MMETSP0109-20121206/5714_1 /TAXON_ID=29199 /ORGANISM="Chlorarachnion reptans, Strain CCCM449" /LENGTH=212 /DNA_ID=CAMNT_0001673599 /DNA_START=39 /DNA_END=677 /DNA_ORIENTATION=+
MANVKEKKNVTGDSWPPKPEEYLYIPNIIDYLRVVALIYAMMGHTATIEGDWHFVTWYSVSYLLDAVDGVAARYFNQCSKLGYYLDMIIDRISSSLALYKASVRVPNVLFSITLLALIVLVEILAHAVVMYFSEVLKVHQKDMGGDFQIVKLYLGSKLGLGFGCICYEAMLLAIILNAPTIVVLLFLPGFAFRAAANLVRLWACANLKKKDP